MAKPARSEAMAVGDLFGGPDIDRESPPARTATPIPTLPAETASGGRKDLPGAAEIPRVGTIPEYGSLSASAERALYDADRSAWIEYVAPGAARRLISAGPDAIRLAWSAISREYQVAIWKHLTPSQRDAFRAALQSPELEAA